jgi:hypothetical protein
MDANTFRADQPLGDATLDVGELRIAWRSIASHGMASMARHG